MLKKSAVQVQFSCEFCESLVLQKNPNRLSLFNKDKILQRQLYTFNKQNISKLERSKVSLKHFLIITVLINAITCSIYFKTTTDFFGLLDLKQPVQVFCKKGFRKNFAKLKGKHLFQSLFLNKYKTPTQLFSCEFCKILKNTFIIEHL